MEKLLKLIKNDIKTGEQTIVFCKNITTTNFVCDFLNSWEIDANRLHARRDANQRQTVFQNFINGDCKVLVATDHTSRGLDTIKVSGLLYIHFIIMLSKMSN